MTERQSKLVKLVNLYQKIEVSRLAELLDVSQVTIRKDLDHLEEEGLLSREHGYALIKNANDINTRLTINYDKKIEIATKAAEMVSNGETVMLESGSTCTLLAEQLAKLKKDITIITNSAYIAIRIRDLPIRKVILLGGEYQKEYQGMVGPLVRKCAKECDIKLQEGVYVQFTGPNYETPAEVRLAQRWGGDAVGMSTACEAMAARHMGMEICGISCITNMAAGISQKELNHKEVQETADRVAKSFKELVTKVVVNM